MRASLLFLLLLATAACNRSPAPGKSASVALPPPTNASVAQAVAAGGTPQPAAEAVLSAAGPAAATLRPAPGAKPADSFGKRAPGGADPRWRNIDPNLLPTTPDPALAEFQAEQKRRDAELMQHDAEEAETVRDDRARRDDRVVRDDPRYREDPREDARYDDGRYDDGRFDDGRYDDGRYDPPPPYGGDERDFEEPPPYFEGDEDFDPGLDEGYDPEEDDRYYQRR